MTDENPWQSLLDQLPADATISRELVDRINARSEGGAVRTEDLTVPVIAAIVQLEQRLLELESKKDEVEEVGIDGGGIHVFDQNEKPWEQY